MRIFIHSFIRTRSLDRFLGVHSKVASLASDSVVVSLDVDPDVAHVRPHHFQVLRYDDGAILLHQVVQADPLQSL